MTTKAATKPKPQRRAAAQAVEVGPCDHCLSDCWVPIDTQTLMRARARGTHPLPTEMPCPTCRTENGSTGVRRRTDLRDHPYVPDYLPAHWTEIERPEPEPEPAPRWVDPTPYVRAITADIAARRAARAHASA